MKKICRLVALLLCVSLLLGICAAAGEDYVYPDDWSRDALIFAVENGVLKGDSDKQLYPERNITRAEMAAMLVRLLGATETADLSSYTDVEADAWYVEELSASVACGVFTGVSATQMQPDQFITREQAVVVLCRAFGIVSENTEEWSHFNDGDQVALYARDSVSAMAELGLMSGYSDGTFGPKRNITRAETAQLIYNIFDCIADRPEEIPASGTVMYRGTEPLPEELELDGTLILGQRMPSDLTITRWDIRDSLVLRTKKLSGQNLSAVTTEKLVLAPQGGDAHLAESPRVFLWGAGMDFEGQTELLVVMGGSHSYSGHADKIHLRNGSLCYAGTAGEVTVEASCALEMNGEAELITVIGERASVTGSGHAAKIVSHPEEKTITLSCDELQDIWYETIQKEHDSALEVVQTQRIPVTVWSRATLYADRALSTPLQILEVGTTVYFEYHPDDRVYVSLEDGTKGWMMRWACTETEGLVTSNGELDYSQLIKEGFVDLGGYESKTEYLIWVSRYTQRVMVFRGSKGDWSLIKTMRCSSGSNETPTPAGVFETFDHPVQWNYVYYYVNKITSFNGNHAFHTVPYRMDGTFLDTVVGFPVSHGCVRLMPEDAQYIYDLPLGTCVVVF